MKSKPSKSNHKVSKVSKNHMLEENIQPRKTKLRSFITYALPLALLAAVFIVAILPRLSDEQPSNAIVAAAKPGETQGAEARLLNDQNVQWLGTFDSGSDWKKRWGIGPGFPSNSYQDYRPDNTKVQAPSFSNSGNVLDVKLGGPNRDEHKYGMSLRSSFDQIGVTPLEEAYFRYRIYLPANFDCVEGGKIPGLAGLKPGDNATSTVGGGDYSDRGWSGRLMFRYGDGGAYSDKADSGCYMISYMYVKHANSKDISNSTGRYIGISPYWTKDAKPSTANADKVLLKKGQWHDIEVRYKMNTPGKNDGIHQGWLNGKLALNLNDVQYRQSSNPNLKINQIFNTTFYGGAEWSTKENHLYFDDYVISRAYIGPRGSSSPAPVPSPPPSNPAPSPTPSPTPSPEEPTPTDPNPATIEIKNIVPNETVSGMIIVEAEPVGASNIKKIDFYVNDNFINSEVTKPYYLQGDRLGVAYGWDSRSVPDGSYTLKAVLTYDNNKAVEEKVSFKVNNNTNQFVEAERALVISGGRLRYDVGATNTSAVRLTETGSRVMHAFTVPSTGNYDIGAVIRSQDYRGSAKAAIYLDGKLIATAEAKTRYAELDLDNRKFTGGSRHIVAIEFTNDECGYGRTACNDTNDRNLFVDRLVLRKR